LRFEDLQEQLHRSSEDSLLLLEKAGSLKEILLFVDELKKDQKQIFILKYGKGFTFKTIAEITGISEIEKSNAELKKSGWIEIPEIKSKEIVYVNKKGRTITHMRNKIRRYYYAS